VSDQLQFFDSHAHITSDTLYGKSSELIENAKRAGVQEIINIATDMITLKRGLELGLRNTAAITPHDSSVLGIDTFEFFAAKAREKKLVAVGETGLDYHYFPDSKDKQKEVFIQHLHLALETDLPVVIHCREAFKDFYEILDAEYVGQWGSKLGIMHCFTGMVEEAKQALDRGWYISFSGIVTFKKSVELQEVAKMVPLERMLIETDSPYLAPLPFRGKENAPEYVVHTAQAIAELRGVTLEEIAKATWDNGHRAFCI